MPMDQKQVVDDACFHICEVRAAMSLLLDSRKKSLALTKLDEAELWLGSLKDDILHGNNGR
jgi:hypothetical protein